MDNDKRPQPCIVITMICYFLFPLSNSLRLNVSGVYACIQEGDRLRAADYVTGSVEIRQLRSVYKLSFVDIVCVNRFKPAEAPPLPSDVYGSDNESTESRAKAAKEAKERAAVRLYVYLTKKKAKTRMADLEETAFLLRLDVGTEGCICLGKSFGTFDQVNILQG